MSVKNKLKKNIILNYIYKGILSFDFTATLWVVYMYSKGISLGKIGLAEAVYHITGMFMQIPTGIIADRLGRKISRVMGAVLYFVDALLMLYAQSFLDFCIVFIISSLAGCMESGAGDALVYESIIKLEAENSYKKIAGRIVLIMNASEAISMLLGGILAQRRIIMAYTLAAGVKSSLVIVSLLFTEPDKYKNKNRNESFKRHLVKSMGAVYRNKSILHFILLNSILEMVMFIIMFYGRKYFTDTGMGYQASGILYTIYLVLGAAGGYYAYKICSFLSLKTTMLMLSILSTAGFLGFSAGVHAFAVISFLLIGICAGLLFPVSSDYINSRIPTEYRAAILSAGSAVFSILMVSFFPVIGIIADKTGLIPAFRIIAIPCIIIITVECYLICRSLGIKK
ncbi:MAG: MFS transporter [Bacillota bacterium]|nr:MFS transporter [Bacillota bacterium]